MAGPLNTIFVHESADLTSAKVSRETGYWFGLVHDKLARHGAVLLRDIELQTPTEFNELVSALSSRNSWFTYQQRATPRTALGGNIYTSTEYPPHLSIFAHNECANQKSWPAKLYFYCNQPSARGGATPLTDIRAVTERISPPLSKIFRDKGLLYLRSIGGPLGVSLDYAFGTSDRAEIERYCFEEAIAINWRSESSLEMRFCRPSFRSHPVTGDELWFNHLMFYSLVSLDPALRDKVRRIPPNRRAYHAMFGDETEVPASELERLRHIYDETTTRFEWRKGDLLILDNMFWAHGRDPYEGRRDLWVALTEPTI